MQEGSSMQDIGPFDPEQFESDFWESVTFSFTMDQRLNNQGEGSSKNKSTQRGQSQRARSSSAASQVPHQMSSHHQGVQLPSMPPGLGPPPLSQVNPQDAYEEFTRALRTLEATYPHLQQMGRQIPPIQIPPIQAPQHQVSPPQMSHLPSDFDPILALSWLQNPGASGQWGNPYPTVDPHHAPGQSSHSASSAEASYPRISPSSSSSTPRAESPQETRDLTEAERQAIAEDKRRRNTAASARFRIKKKQKVLNLERSVSDLTGRAEELEREAAELRRENGWLKEIIVLKSKTAGGMMPELDPSELEGSVAGPSGSTQEEDKESDKSDEQESRRRKKGKKKA